MGKLGVLCLHLLVADDILHQFSWRTAVMTLRAMTDGLPHPKAQRRIIVHDLYASFSSEWWGELHINGSRLGVVFRPVDAEDNGFSVVVWDWTTGQMVLVCVSHKSAKTPTNAVHPIF